ncbi:MAG: hypothetical protein KC729_02525 [Candidatus Eisenbacteria bacterium]|uniref:DUF1570 domain-containing protein n=1 Tax=Eiseniibacteriota bacterium TaxID=2212470 RepID=A0A956LWW4_UNCEI|nr:hypothetical protein [Candidatus Eisenbacteria bacterium]
MERRRRIRHSASAFVIFLVLAPAVVGADTGWLRVATDDFSIYSNAKGSEATRLAGEIILLRSVLQQTTTDMRVLSPLPTNVYVFRDEKSFEPFNLDATGNVRHAAGYFRSSPDGNYVALTAGGDEDAEATLRLVRHEYMHYFLNNNFPKLPVWLDEGLAECFSNTRIDGEIAEIGRPLTHHREWLAAESWIPLPALVSVDRSSPLYRGEGTDGGGSRGGEARQAVFYAESWLLTHYLFCGDASRPGRINDVIRRIEKGEDGWEVVLSETGMGEAELVKTLKLYNVRGSFPFHRWTCPREIAVGSLVNFQPLNEVETSACLGDLMAHGPGGEAEAERVLSEAVKDGAGNSLAYDALGYLYHEEGRRGLAFAAAERAIALDSLDVRSRVLAATCLAESSAVSTNGLALQREARSHLRICMAAQPGNYEHHLRFGGTFTEETDGLWEGVSALIQAQQAMPFRKDVATLLAILTAKTGNIDGARALRESLRRSGAGDGYLQRVDMALRRAEIDKINSMVEGKSASEALNAYRDAMRVTDDVSIRREVQDRIRRLEQREAEEPALDRYRQGVDLAVAGKLDEAIEVWQAVQAETNDPVLRITAQTAIEQAHHHQELESARRLVREGRLRDALTKLDALLGQELRPEMKEQAAALHAAVAGELGK